MLPGGCVPPAGGTEAQALLDEARALLERVEAERNRLAQEVTKIRAGQLTAFALLPVLVPGAGTVLQAVALTDPLKINERARQYEGLIDQLERFVFEVFARVEEKAVAGDVDAARRLRDGTARILGAAASSSATRELADDVRLTVDDVLRDLKRILTAIAATVATGVGAFIAFKAVDTVLRLRGRK